MPPRQSVSEDPTSRMRMRRSLGGLALGERPANRTARPAAGRRCWCVAMFQRKRGQEDAT